MAAGGSQGKVSKELENIGLEHYVQTGLLAIKKDYLTDEELKVEIIRLTKQWKAFSVGKKLALEEDAEKAKSIDFMTNKEKILHTWDYPHGQNMNAIIVWVNHYVDDDFVYIPCEIAMVAFTVKEGIKGKFWTLVDPKTIPMGHGCFALNNEDKFGVPSPKKCGEEYQNLQQIMNDIENFIQKYPAFNPETGTSEPQMPAFNIFCSRQNINAVTKAFEWLYSSGGSKFEHKILSLELLLIVLSTCGLETLANKNNKSLIKLTEDLNSACLYSQVSRANPGALRYQNDESLQIFISSVHGGGSFTNMTTSTISKHITFGKDFTRQRKAFLHQNNHPNAMLGAFLFESQAEDYMKLSDFSHLKSLACKYHADRDGYGCTLKGVSPTGDPDKTPEARMTNCALLNVLRQLYLALDVLLVNYYIDPRKGKHYPSRED